MSGGERIAAGARGRGAMRAALSGLGLLLVALGCAGNPWVAAALVPGGALAAEVRAAVAAVDLLLIGAGVGVLAARHSLAARLATGLFVDGEPWLERILAAGIALRVVVYAFLRPHNNDPHWHVIDYIVAHHALPDSTELMMSFQPPLYYVLAAPLAAVGPWKLVQLLSLLLSLLDLWLLYRLIARTRLLRDYGARCHALLLAALLPQLVVFGNFVSNDTLAFALGTLLFTQAFRYIDDPRPRQLVLLALVQGAAMLTKGTALAFFPVVLAVVVVVEWRRPARTGTRHVLLAGMLFTSLAGAVGSYKLVENTVRIGEPFATNESLQRAWIRDQQGLYQGMRTLVDVNVAKLVRRPFVSEDTMHSVPLLLYATYWYSYLDESNLLGTRERPLTLLPRALCLAGLLPTLLMVLGAASWAWRRGRARAGGADDAFRTRVQGWMVIAALLAHLAVVVAWGLEHDAHSFFQARLLFPCAFSFAVLLGRGVEVVRGRWPAKPAWLDVALLGVWLVALAWFAAELTFVAAAP